MQQIISFLIRNKHSLLFLFLLVISLGLTIQSHSFHRSRFINSANVLSGGVYESASGIGDYFKLKTYNKQLLDENARLRSYIEQNVNTDEVPILDSAFAKALSDGTDVLTFEFIPARVIDNNYAKTNNYITIKSTDTTRITTEMGVITSQGIIGITDKTSHPYSTVLSILNTNFSTNAKLKNSDHSGSLSWDGINPNIIQLSDVQQQAAVKKGDTIETSGKSAYFPKGIPIGTIADFSLDTSGNFYTIQLRLFNDMTNLGHAYVIKNNDRTLIKALELQQENEE